MELIATNGNYGLFRHTGIQHVQGWENCAGQPTGVWRGRAGGYQIFDLKTWEPDSGVTFKRRDAERWLKVTADI